MLNTFYSSNISTGHLGNSRVYGRNVFRNRSFLLYLPLFGTGNNVLNEYSSNKFAISSLGVTTKGRIRGKFGESAVTFTNGKTVNNSWLATANTTGLSIAAGETLSISFWMYLSQYIGETTGPEIQEVIINKGIVGSGSSGNYMLDFDLGNPNGPHALRFLYTNNAVQGYAISTTDNVIYKNMWYYIAFSYTFPTVSDATAPLFWINAIPQPVGSWNVTPDGTVSNVSSPLVIGDSQYGTANTGTDNRGFNGALQEIVMLKNQAFTTQELQKYYAGAFNNFSNAAPPTKYFTGLTPEVPRFSESRLGLKSREIDRESPLGHANRIAYWPISRRSTAFLDLEGTNHLTPTGTFGNKTDGKFRQGVVEFLNDVSVQNYASSPTNTSLNMAPGDTLSVSFWIYVTKYLSDTTQNSMVILNKAAADITAGAAGNYLIQFGQHAGDKSSEQNRGPHRIMFAYTTTVPAGVNINTILPHIYKNRWYHIAFSYTYPSVASMNKPTIWINGVPVELGEWNGTPNGTVQSGSTTLRVGNSEYGVDTPADNRGFNGIIQELMIFKNRAFTTAQISNYYNWATRRQVTTSAANEALDYVDPRKFNFLTINKESQKGDSSGTVRPFFKGDSSLVMSTPLRGKLFEEISNKTVTVTGSPAPYIGRHTTSYDFPSRAAGNYITVGAAGDYQIGNNFTAMLWVRPTDTTAFSGLIAKINVGLSKGWELGVSNTGTPSPPTGSVVYLPVFRNSNVQFLYIERRSYTNLDNAGYFGWINQWTHVAITTDVNTARLYINGILAAEQYNYLSYDFNDNTLPLIIGGRRTAQAECFVGQLCDVALFSRALDPKEIYDYYRYATTKRNSLNSLITMANFDFEGALSIASTAAFDSFGGFDIYKDLVLAGTANCSMSVVAEHYVIVTMAANSNFVISSLGELTSAITMLVNSGFTVSSTAEMLSSLSIAANAAFLSVGGFIYDKSLTINSTSAFNASFYLTINEFMSYVANSSIQLNAGAPLSFQLLTLEPLTGLH